MIITLLALLACSILGIIYLTFRSIKQKKYLVNIESELEQLHEKYEELSGEIDTIASQSIRNDLVDMLTGLPDRRVFEDRLLQAISNSGRKKSVFAILTLDIDDLKLVDKLGNDVGDKLLREFASRLQSSIRQVDTVTRFAGGCFLFLLPHLSRPETAIYVAQRIQDNLMQTFKINAYELSVKASIGIAIYPVDGNDAKTLLENAETALKQAKSAGKNRYQFYQSELHALGQRELSLATLIRSPSLLNKIDIKYRPFFEASTNSAVYIQATMHLHHPEFGLVPFTSLIHILENSGKMIEVTQWLLKNAIAQFQTWQHDGFKPSYLGIPLSLRQLENPHFVYMLEETLKQKNSDGNIKLVLEISDENVYQNPAFIEKIFTLLNSVGIKVAVGVIALGHFSMQKINKIPLNYLRIDSKLTQAIGSQEDKIDILGKIIELAKDEGIIVMAEGVENEKQKTRLKEIGCELMEGKLFGYLMPTGSILEGQS